MTMLQSQATTVGQLLKDSRMLAGLTVREIAPHVGVSFATVSAWERGQGEPSARQFVAWAHATKQPLDQMIEGLLPLCTPSDLNREPTD